MRESRFGETQIVEVLKEGEAGMPVVEILRKHGIRSQKSSGQALVMDHHESHQKSHQLRCPIGSHEPSIVRSPDDIPPCGGSWAPRLRFLALTENPRVGSSILPLATPQYAYP